jgi:predicted RNA-binding protein with PUA-like domain
MYWLFKSEEKEFSVEDFFKEPDLTTEWDGIRNYQARNYLKKDVRKGYKLTAFI